ncbi:MAG TPA: hypothetical protein VH682_22040 [Gemmataceae bacterium]|jgi:hypothetical protein
MPRPFYIVCAVSGALDKRTNAISLFGLVETIEFHELKPPPDAQPGTPLVVAPLSMLIATAWLREEGDSPEQYFEAEIVCFLPGSDEPALTVPFEPFRFERPVHRLIVWETTLSPELDMKPGLLRFVNRVRRAGGTEWTWEQEYVIRMEQGHEMATALKAPPPQVDTSS